jgi:cell wall-associated NlpC family hydrolase
LAYQDYPQAIGDLVYRDSDRQIYGRDGADFSTAISHPGHVGIYVGNGQIVHAIATSIWFIPDVSGEIMLSPLAASSGVHSFYEDWGEEDGVEDHGHMGAKAHGNLLTNVNAAMFCFRWNVHFAGRV